VARLTVWTRADGTAVLSRRCREGPVDCEARLGAFAALIVRAARRHGVDPYLLAALAMRESGLDPSALGRNREAGIVQLHPRGAGRDVRFVQDDAYRAACQGQVDACQGPVLDRGAATLARSIADCGSVRAGLGAYASGHCTASGVHPQRVLEERRQLADLARAE
ncbi:MAG: transglycosylase SLT domain-containing protein, partial [Sandaracinaceae bacterium]|nr:transglycosylase SLT domain-containing protein [Sandaracinaceae bacterium]